MKILIIEDEPDTACMMKQLLESEHEVHVAYTGQEAIQTSITFPPELIISDWNLNDEMDGVTACKHISEHCQPVIIFVSGSPIEQLHEVAAALSPLHILTKPLDIEKFCSLIEKMKMGCKKVVGG